jgi:hypothetical protein
MSTPTTTTTSMFFDEGTYEASDDESAEAMTFDLGCQVMIPFGKHRGSKLGDHVTTRVGRSYLRYLLEWDGLFAELRASIQCVMDAYNVIKKDGGSNKRRRT